MKYQNELRSLSNTDYQVESDIKLAIMSPLGSSCCWVLVEGEDDLHFYERMFVSVNVQVAKAGYVNRKGEKRGGFQPVIDIVSNILKEQRTEKIIGIIDRDYISFKTKGMCLPHNVFVTDMRDLEMTMMSSPIVQAKLRTVVHNSLDPEYKKVWGCSDWYDNLWKRCCDVCRMMGLYRIAWSKLNMPQRIEYKISLVWSEKNRCNEKKWRSNITKSAIKQAYDCTGFFSVLRLLFTYRKVLRFSTSVNEWKIYRGHDFVQTYSSFLINKSEFSAKWITYFIIMEYPLSEIRRTQLYHSIDEWQNSHGLSILI